VDVNNPPNPTSVQIPMNTNVYVGLALTSHDAALTCEAVFSSVQIQIPDTGTVPAGWKNRDIGILSNEPEQMYLAVQDSVGRSSISLHEDPNAALLDTWQEWNIDMNDFRDDGVQLNSIKKLALGFGTRGEPSIPGGGTPGGSGLVFFDDIRLYRPRFMEDLLPPWPPDFARDGVIDYLDLDVLTDNWLISSWDVTPQDPGATGLIGWYRFEGNTNDSSVNGNHGDPCGAPTYSTDSKEGTYSIELDGVDDYVNVGAVGIDGNSPRTIAGWVKANSTVIPDWTNIFGFTGASGGGLHFDMQITGVTAATYHGYGLHVYGWERSLAPLDLEWHHLAATYDGATIAWYAEGHLHGSEEIDLNTTDNVQMGKRGDNDNYFPGLVDDVRIYGRALSQGEIGYLAGQTTTYTQPLYLLLTPQNPDINLYDDGTIDFKDYDGLADVWGDEQLWPEW
jgi:hypothetical protein